MSKIMSISVIVLLLLGGVFSVLRIVGQIHWHWVWVASPIFLAVVIYVILIILAVVFGMEIS
jgi:hypothetical protein